MPRVHPGAWWLWAVALGTVASRTTNPLLLGLVLAVAGAVVLARRENTPWANSYGVFLRFGLIVIAIRTVFHIILGGVAGTTILFTLPRIPLPDWAHGIRIGGPVTAEGLVAALYDGFHLAVLLACVGAANALANPRRLLRSLPAALYEVSVAVVVALTAAPQLIASTKRIKRARALRGDTARGPRAIRSILVPVLEDALDGSLSLAAAMDSRGYGRTAGLPAATRRLTAALVLAGLLGICVGAFGLLDAGSPAIIGLPMLLVGLLLAAIGLFLGGRRLTRTTYRPDRWGRQEAVIVASGLVAVATALFATADLHPGFGVPGLPVIPTIGVLTALLPAWKPNRP